MIKANELRIGNLINKDGKEYRILPMDIMVLYGEDDTDFCDNYNPVPLTPEWMERCGFEKGCLARQLNEDWLIYYNDGLWFQVEKQTDRGYICERMPLFHIKNLHQLQNFYYALTGEELTISDQNDERNASQQKSNQG